MRFNPKCMASGIGSFPHKNASAACELILRTIPEMPVWPQLSKIDFREQMEVQFSEGLPCVVLDDAKQRMYFETSGEPTRDLEQFYEACLSENLEYFKISADFSRGIYAMEEVLSKKDLPPAKLFKSQVTGPVTFGLSIVDEKKRAIYYNEVFRDVIVKGMAMKARWMLNKFKPLGLDQLCFIDEPILSAFGSSTYVSVQRAEVVSYISEVVQAIHKEGALAGAHCCGNTEWPILIDSGVDIISFDAYGFGETIGYYPEQVKKFLESGGALAWGIIPTSEKILQETPGSLIKKLEEIIKNLAGKGINENLIWEKCLLTPSCGTGSLSEELSEKVFFYLSEVSGHLRR